MRWLPYFILAYVALGLQIGLGDLASWQGARPSLVLVAVVFVALNAPRNSALLGCFAMGLFQDWLTQQPLGLYAISYGLVAMLISGTTQPIYRQHPLAHVGFTLVGGLVTATVLALHAWLRPAGPRLMADGAIVSGAMRISTVALFLSAIYTALLAPVLLWGLNRMRRAFAFQGSSYRRSLR